ncbi:hypothetical protein [Deinococcus gobiensis]|uniref:Type 4 fimbrial biogenesis protein PilX N-terminal domain-containing protein n=1 Tax=Deinococcus gobiensis (strain DSM 21396 / JCM 16679 / CGMCC 1.7299 / I-0) TaxID=745776 RepID=H8H1U1_DEIGI|nr:hypothetical protein [Deinococcus gobiensis]AFD27488.1 hypothetical protein DGo_PB0219 [Deinococcus gobiensis I-0]
MKRPTAGYAMVIALILVAALAVTAASIVQTTARNTRTAATYTRGAVLGVQQRNVLSYSSRLLEANASRLTQSLPAPSAGVRALQDALQTATASWCTRDPDGQGQNRIRVYFRMDAAACGQALPSGVALPDPKLETAGDLTRASLPFVIVAPSGGRTAIQAGSLLAQYGAAPASTYSLLVPNDLNLTSHLRLNGTSQVDGILRVQTPATLSGTIGTSNCNAITTTCAGTRSLTVNGAAVPVMSLAPSAGRPAGVGGSVVIGTPSESADLSPLPAPQVGLVTSELTLSVQEGGEQVMKGCFAIFCTTYYVKNGNLYRGSLDSAPIFTGWDGLLAVNAAGGDLTIQGADPNASSVGIPLGIVTASNVVIKGDLTYEQTNCIDGLCNSAGTSQFLSVQAPSVRVTTETRQVHGTFITPNFISNAPLTLFGTIIGMPQGSDVLNIQPDTRAQDGLRAPGTPLLASRWRQPSITLTP